MLDELKDVKLDLPTDLAEVEIPSIVAEANAKISGHNRQLSEVGRSFTTETASNALFLYFAYQLDLPHIEEAIFGALLVYVPLAYDATLGIYKRSNLKEGIREYTSSRDTSVFDKMGLTFRGNNIDTSDTHEPFFTLSSVFDPINITPRNNYGLIGSGVDYLYYTFSAVAAPALRGAKKLKRIFSKSAQDTSAPKFAYLQDPCSAANSKVIRTTLPEVNPNAVVQMPFHAERIKSSRRYTISNTIPDYVKIGSNAVGIYGALEFCTAVGADIAPRVSAAINNADPLQAAVAAGWAATVVIGAGPAKHFMDDAKKIAKRLHIKWAIANVKTQAIEHRQNVRDIQRSIKDALSQYYRAEIAWDKDSQKQALRTVSNLLSDKNGHALDDDIIALLRHRKIDASNPAPTLEAHPT